MEGTSTMLRKAMFLWVGLLCISGPAMSDTLLVEGISAESKAGFPQRGLSKAGVAADFGEPQSRGTPVGDPPISRWEYGSFVVFFEYDRVLHSVARR